MTLSESLLEDMLGSNHPLPPLMHAHPHFIAPYIKIKSLRSKMLNIVEESQLVGF